MASNLRLSNSNVATKAIMQRVEKIELDAIIGENLGQAKPGTVGNYIPKIETQSANVRVYSADTWNYPAVDADAEIAESFLPYYKIYGAFSVNKDETANYAANGYAFTPEGIKKDMVLQGMEQEQNRLMLFGFDNSTQGIVNSVGSFENLPQDSAGATTLSAYKGSDLFAYLTGIMRDITANTYGSSIPVTILAAPEAIAKINFTIVNLLDNQNAGGGTNSIGGSLNNMIQHVYGNLSISLVSCSYLRGAGVNGTDRMIVMAPKFNNAGTVEDLAGVAPAENTVADFGGLLDESEPTLGKVSKFTYELYTSPAQFVRGEAGFGIDYTL